MRVRDGLARLADTDTLAGSTRTLDQAVRNAATVAGVPLEAALRAATQAPARTLHVNGRGTIEPGARGPLVVFDTQLRATTTVSST